jgi:predicted lipid-binding transport protein (Tim44 family)
LRIKRASISSSTLTFAALGVCADEPPDIAQRFEGGQRLALDARQGILINRMENIALRESEISEVWTENGEDFITVRLHANLLDYTVDAKTGAVVSGSNSEPIEFEEYWTFSRPVGPNAWKLAAVQQA